MNSNYPVQYVAEVWDTRAGTAEAFPLRFVVETPEIVRLQAEVADLRERLNRREVADAGVWAPTELDHQSVGVLSHKSDDVLVIDDPPRWWPPVLVALAATFLALLLLFGGGCLGGRVSGLEIGSVYGAPCECPTAKTPIAKALPPVGGTDAERLVELWTSLNEKLYAGAVECRYIGWSKLNAEGDTGKYVCGRCVVFPGGPPMVLVDRDLPESDLIGTVAHEMIHASGIMGHGPKFVAECRRAAKVLNIPVERIR